MKDDFLPLLIEDPKNGFTRGRNYPGTFTADGQCALVANDEGRLVRVRYDYARVDVIAWRRRLASGDVDADTTKALRAASARIRAAHKKLDDLRKGGTSSYASVREAVRADLREIAELLDPVLARELWEAVDGHREDAS